MIFILVLSDTFSKDFVGAGGWLTKCQSKKYSLQVVQITTAAAFHKLWLAYGKTKTKIKSIYTTINYNNKQN